MPESTCEAELKIVIRQTLRQHSYEAKALNVSVYSDGTLSVSGTVVKQPMSDEAKRCMNL